ncbi:hypothetical protein NY2A_b817R [Paramecium bursaria Chlorella virus NY2A]|uniref:Uncharacterized protein b817R n=1 Tax=Paramecium bursaria Chlorella virus NY2A TaxID=46021 RepID=A7IXZ2_PBCVN|nr:hypothetical protein NY2A_b817R [Paramecium bursaria Chlorella virus NY2A]ABT15216.1 hypothetical protein NY2A_b817R [Paramecium bursaria Chlorella virus NY2A]
MSLPIGGAPLTIFPPPSDMNRNKICDVADVNRTMYAVPYAPPPIFFAPNNTGLNIVPDCLTRSFEAARASSMGMFARGFARRLLDMRCDSA